MYLCSSLCFGVWGPGSVFRKAVIIESNTCILVSPLVVCNHFTGTETNYTKLHWIAKNKRLLPVVTHNHFGLHMASDFWPSISPYNMQWWKLKHNHPSTILQTNTANHPRPSRHAPAAASMQAFFHSLGLLAQVVLGHLLFVCSLPGCFPEPLSLFSDFIIPWTSAPFHWRDLPLCGVCPASPPPYSHPSSCASPDPS